MDLHRGARDAASETRLRDEIAAASETPKAKRQRIDKKMVAAPEKSEVSEKSQASDAFEELAQEGRAAPEKSGASEASEASEKYVGTGYVINNHLAVNPFYKRAMNHTDFFCMMLGGAINAIFAGENHALQWISNPCANGDVFSMNCLDEEWYLELGNNMKGGAGRGSMGKSQKQWAEAVQAWAKCQKPEAVDARGGQGRPCQQQGMLRPRGQWNRRATGLRLSSLNPRMAMFVQFCLGHHQSPRGPWCHERVVTCSSSSTSISNCGSGSSGGGSQQQQQQWQHPTAGIAAAMSTDGPTAGATAAAMAVAATAAAA